MTFALILAIAFTISVSALCSVLEAMLLSTTTAEIESLKRRHPRRGQMLEKYQQGIEETSSAILSLNTIANTLGATTVGGLAVKIWADSENILFVVSLAMALSILFFSEIIPKNVGIIYRESLQPWLVPALGWVRACMMPLSRTVGLIIRQFLRAPESNQDQDEEIILLADKGAKEGTMTVNERDMISNALSLDDILVHEIMTPRIVVQTLNAAETVGDLFDRETHIPFGRLPVFQDDKDNIVGVVRRRDLLEAMAKDRDAQTIESMMRPVLFIPDNAVAGDALQSFLKAHQQLAVAVDEFGNMSGVITMEDIIEHIIGQEIFEADDPAVDMREFARRTQFARKRAEKQRD